LAQKSAMAIACANISEALLRAGEVGTLING